MDQMQQEMRKMFAELMVRLSPLDTSATGNQSVPPENDSNQSEQPSLGQSHSVHGIVTSHQTQLEIVYPNQDQTRFEQPKYDQARYEQLRIEQHRRGYGDRDYMYHVGHHELDRHVRLEVQYGHQDPDVFHDWIHSVEAFLLGMISQRTKDCSLLKPS